MLVSSTIVLPLCGVTYTKGITQGIPGLRSALQDPVLEVTLSQKCLIQMCAIHKCYPATSSWSARVVCRRCHVHVNMTVPAGCDISHSAVSSCCESHALKSNSKHAVFPSYMDIHIVYRLCYGNATAAFEEYQLQYPWWWISDSHVFTHIHHYMQEKGYFLSVDISAECPVQKCGRRRKYFWHSTPEATHYYT